MQNEEKVYNFRIHPFEDTYETTKYGTSVPTLQLGTLTMVPSETARYVCDVADVVKEAITLPEGSILRKHLPNKISAIKRVREDIGCGLKDAKEFVEFVWWVKGV
jgi:hypothetical protein